MHLGRDRIGHPLPPWRSTHSPTYPSLVFYELQVAHLEIAPIFAWDRAERILRHVTAHDVAPCPNRQLTQIGAFPKREQRIGDLLLLPVAADFLLPDDPLDGREQRDVPLGGSAALLEGREFGAKRQEESG
jgi:hypothetical protein